jgi:hypothetical protein
MSNKRWRILAAVGSIGLAAAVIGCSVTPGKNSAGTGGVTTVVSDSPSPAAPSPSPDAPSPTPKPIRTTTLPTAPKPTPTIVPLKPLQCQTVTGKPQSASHVRGLLTTASHHNVYVDTHQDPATLDTSLNGKLPDVHVPLSMLKAVAAIESSWTSTCVSSDGNEGYGVMQMDDNATAFVNQHFGTSYVKTDQDTNVLLGNAYLEYLTVHFGLEYYHNNFNLSTNIPLRTAVLAAYNTGLSTVDVGGTAPHIGPVGGQYAKDVSALMHNTTVQTKWGY